MTAYLITGRGGSGKTAVCEELAQRGLPSFDADRVPGLARAIDRTTGQPTKVDWSGYVDYAKVAWNWDSHILDQFLRAHDPVFLCGSASNQLEFHHLFTKVFALQLDPATHRTRLRTRDSEYGKNHTMEEFLLREQRSFTNEALALGALPIDATSPISAVVDEIIRQTGAPK